MYTLMPYEKEWVADRLRIYEIKYAEVYNEVYDHMLSAIAAKRADGDIRPILHIFQETMDQDFGSHKGLAEMTEERASLVSGILRDSLKAEFFKYYNSGKALWTMGVFVTAYLLVLWLEIPIVFIAVPAVLLSIFPVFYISFFGFSRRHLSGILSKRKRSMVNEHMLVISSSMLIILNGVLHALPMLISWFVGDDRFLLRGGIDVIGVFGMLVMTTLAWTYMKAVIKVANTDYKIMMKDVVVQ